MVFTADLFVFKLFVGRKLRSGFSSTEEVDAIEGRIGDGDFDGGGDGEEGEVPSKGEGPASECAFEVSLGTTDPPLRSSAIETSKIFDKKVS